MSAARRVRAAVAGALVAALLAAGAVAQPAPFAVESQATTLAGARVTVDVYRPLETLAESADAPDAQTAAAPVAIVAHGFSRDRTRGRDLGRELAAAGIVAIVPDLPNLVDYWGNAAAIRDVVAQLERGAFGLPPTWRGQLVLIGTSAGGVATLIAASKLPGIAGWIGLDPVDRSGTAALAAEGQRARDRAARRSVGVQPVRQRPVDRAIGADAAARAAAARRVALRLRRADEQLLPQRLRQGCARDGRDGAARDGGRGARDAARAGGTAGRRVDATAAARRRAGAGTAVHAPRRARAAGRPSVAHPTHPTQTQSRSSRPVSLMNRSSRFAGRCR